MFTSKNLKIAIIGLGYVGLPLAIAFSKKFQVVAFDINFQRINALRTGSDATKEVPDEELLAAKNLKYTHETEDLKDCQIYIVTVPTPIDAANQPNISALIKASETIGKVLKKNDLVIYESTVYPGATEEDCVPVLESISGLTFNEDFFCGYSPERINPGDKKNSLSSIKKVTSGSTPEAANAVDALYGSIIDAGTHKAASIRVAEAAKVIENTQRDLNIALINELSIIFNKMGIDTKAVLEAAETKWNFMPFRPGLVGGHCIGVDPYYLTHKAEQLGYSPKVILAGRKINNAMGDYVVDQLVRAMIKRAIPVKSSKVLVLGFTFKENCSDFRNTRVIDVISGLHDYDIFVDVHDPTVDKIAVFNEFGIDICEEPDSGIYDAVILAVAHAEFINIGLDAMKGYGKPEHIFFDVKSIYDANQVDLRL